MKGIIIFIMSLFLLQEGCKTSKNSASKKNNAETSASQTVKDTVCEGLSKHVKKYWLYDNKTKLFNYSCSDPKSLLFTKYWNCFIKMDTTDCINLLGKPSVERTGFMFYYMNSQCFEERQENCLWYELKYDSNGNITYIGQQAVHWIKN